MSESINTEKLFELHQEVEQNLANPDGLGPENRAELLESRKEIEKEISQAAIRASYRQETLF